MVVEVLVSLVAAVRSGNVAIGAFGGDSAIELSSAAAVLWRLRSTQERSEATATKITGWLLIALAVFILCQSLYSLFGTASKPQASYLGIALLVAAALVMPWLGRRKRQLAFIANSSSLRGKRRAIIATARKLAVLLHHLWVSGEVYEPLHNSGRTTVAVAA